MTERPLTDFARLRAHATLGSTNDEAKRLAAAGASAWTVVSADVQTAGRGRRGRRWESLAGNLHASLILRPPIPVAAAAQLGFAAALAVGEAIMPLLPPAASLQYKWPNDVLVNDRKIAGILLESASSAAGSALWVVVGIGVNVETCGVAGAATCLVAEGAAAISVPTLLREIVLALHRWAAAWERSGFGPLRRAWLARARGLGAELAVRQEREDITGRFLDLDADGALLLETARGLRRIAAGEIFPIVA